ncbi:PilZ domain-containing protein [Aurantiacibacter spongiae]|uniref:PilZ domain-containing protein n=1 Tax=Aurantiacibacter spongiae TaxID=2488860 RepID=A0A3N5CWH3_9SPHN|nr:PilZ domain-containing protein [Aurantiacibacter spongiae]RPF71900.1 PilZ domain-containing protein [Aurantiacibacter spongiae]
MQSLKAKDEDALRIRCRARSGMNADLEVLDISEGGCMVECRGWSASEGERVLATLPGLAAQPATLVWKEDGRAGIAFEQPLHEAVFTHLSRQVGS